MAAINLRGATNGFWVYKGTTATTWQEFKVGPRQKVTIDNEDTSEYVYIACDKAGDPAGTPETPSHGGAVGTHRKRLNPGADIEIRPNAPGQTPGTGSVFVAGSGTTAYTVTVENDS